MGGTIVYSVNNSTIDHTKYDLQILTVSTQTGSNDFMNKIGELTGSAGHVLLRFKSGGGTMLTSMAHWVELMKIDTSEKKLFEIAEKQYGAVYAQNMKKEYENLDVGQQKAYISSNAINFVQNQAPCSYNYKNM
eukprot:GHVR01038254.1.p1 GENE.GHVR01038254.1~~GHVR01038254.1.p1  ORF type:complete len:134 (+),score=10.20 GHVR01038254.1:1089-1490(+)